MSRPEDIEAVLARLMPAALGEQATWEIEKHIDDLAKEAGVETSFVRTGASPWPWATGAAAAAVLVAFVFWKPGDLSPIAGNSPLRHDSPEIVRISHADMLESVVEEGWRDDVGGKPHQTLRLHMVARQQILDEETGIVMTVSEPREEVLLLPVHTF